MWGFLIEYHSKMHGCTEISQYEILHLFVTIQGLAHTIFCVQYRYKNKIVIIHVIIIA